MTQKGDKCLLFGVKTDSNFGNTKGSDWQNDKFLKQIL